MQMNVCCYFLINQADLSGSRKNDRLNVLKYLQVKIEINICYSKLEVNNILKKWHTLYSLP